MTPEQREQKARECLERIETLQGVRAISVYRHSVDEHTFVRVIAESMAERERAVLEEVAEHHDAEADNWNPFPVAMPSEYTEAIAWSRQQARAQEAAELAGWCRQQIKERS